MAEVKWIKLATGLPDNRKIKQIRKLPNGDTIALMWIFLMCLAGETNDDGMVYFTPEIPFTEEMLADQFDIDINTVRLGLSTFQRFGMIEIVDSIICLSHWEKWQAVDGLAVIREQTRKRVAKHREKQRALISQSQCTYCGGVATGYDHIIAIARGGTDTEENKVPCCSECNRIKNDKPLLDFLNFNRERIVDDLVANNAKLQRHVTLCNVTGRYIVTQSNALDIEEDKEEDKKENKKEKIDYQLIADMYNRLCPSFPRIRSLSEARKKAIKARLNTYTVEDFQTVFENAEASSFLKGQNNRNWTADFDWLIKDANMAKVLDGNYADKPKPKAAQPAQQPRPYQNKALEYLHQLEEDERGNPF